MKTLAVAVLANGPLSFTRHAYEEMANDKLTEVDTVIVAFRTESWAVVVTAWRFKR